MKVLVTGATGFVGSHLCKALLKEGYQVYGTTKSGKVEKIKDILNNDNFQLLQVDLSKKEELDKIPGDIDLLFHNASQQPYSKEITFEDYFEGNLTTTKNLTEYFKDKSLKLFVYSSTTTILNQHNEEVNEETQPLFPLHDYPLTKLWAEMFLKNLSEGKSFKVVTLRFPSIYGQGQDKGIIYHYYHKAIDDEDMDIYSQGRPLRNVIFVEDVVRANLLVIKNLQNLGKHELFLIGAENSMKMIDLAEFIKKTTDSDSKISLVDKETLSNKNVMLDISRAKGALNYQPLTIEEGIKSYVIQKGELKTKIHQTAMPFFPQEEITSILEKIKDVLNNKHMLTMGDHVNEFEKKFAEYVGTKYAIATNSCTSALETALRTIDVKGKEVIVPAQTFIATGSSIASTGGKPIFADINDDFNISLESIKNKITPNTKAVILIHYAGLITKDIFEIKKLCKEKGICLIEDCAHAHGASADNIKAGNLGDIGCFSFYATKIMTTGEGGMIVTNNDQLYETMASIRNRGKDMNSNIEIFNNLGSNYRMAEIPAILGLSQLKYLDKFVEHRQKLAGAYNKIFDGMNEDIVQTIKYKDNYSHSYWRYVIKLNEKIDRKQLKKILLDKNIKIGWPYEPPLHLQPVFRQMYGIQEGHLPFAEKEMKRHICLPMHIDVTEDDAEHIGKTIKEELQQLMS